MFYQKEDFREFVLNFYKSEGRYPTTYDFSKKYLSYYQVLKTFGTLKKMYEEFGIEIQTTRHKLQGDQVIPTQEIDHAINHFVQEFKDEGYIIKKTIIRAKNIYVFKNSLLKKLVRYDEFLASEEKTLLVVISASKKIDKNELENILLTRTNVLIISAEEIQRRNLFSSRETQNTQYAS
jgi:hypothetical protein